MAKEKAMEQEHPIYILKIVDRHARHGTHFITPKVRTLQNPKLTRLAWFDRDLSDHVEEDGPTKCRIYRRY
jgi:hypothetical protein